ncbi:Holliday junction resolvase RecU [Terribacillus sp. 7520-G]|uniref:Holliday junction resolvase RecU n=1 Tax=Terribacillus TaxID=459532 RepID=UPI001E5E768A|nr:Holliday junction resolvase RecU [Terribacillus sp. 7520-G]
MAINYGKRGMEFENLLNYTNNLYRTKKKALINKRPTPMKIVRSAAANKYICVFADKSTVDYDGTYKGRSIVFEAKSVKMKKSFPLDNISDSQVQYLEAAEKVGAISFVIIEMTITREVFYIPNKMLQHYIKQAANGGRKSIPIDEMQVYGYGVKSANGVPLDYLSVVDHLMEEGVA